MRYLPIIVGLLLVSLHPDLVHSQRTIDPELEIALESFMDELFPLSNTTAMGVSVIKTGGELLYTNGWGLADIGRNVPATNSTQYILGSVTKSLTAVLSAKILSEKFPHLGEQVLDTPIRELVPEADFTMVDRYRSEQGSFRDLLSHRTCVTENLVHAASGQLKSLEELFYRARYNEELCVYRGTPSYASYNSQILAMAGALCGIIANKTYEETMQEFFDELGMTESTFPKLDDDYSNMPYRAQPYYEKDGEFHPLNPELTKRAVTSIPGGGIISTANDMAKYMNFLLNLGTVNGKEVVRRDVMEWLFKPVTSAGNYPHSYKSTPGERVYTSVSYAVGFEIASLDGWRVIRHRGNVAPYNTMLATIPEMGLGMFTAANTGPAVNEHQTAILVFLYEWMRGNKENAREVALKTARKVHGTEVEERKSEMEENVIQIQRKFQAARSRLAGGSTTEVVGQYGTGRSGDIEITERWNDEKNTTQYYIEYGYWLQGWLEEMEELEGLYNISWVTGIEEEVHAYGMPPEVLPLSNKLVAFGDSIILVPHIPIVETYHRGVSLDTLPPVPWAPDSC